MSKLKLTDVGYYSISKPFMTSLLLGFVHEISIMHRIQNPVITETCAGLGGFSIGLFPRVKHLNLVEISSTHVDCL